MGDTDDTPGPLRARVFDAVQAEVVESGIDEFSIERVARRAGVDVGVILARWRDRRVLLLDILITSAAQFHDDLDAGNVSGDVRRLAAALAKATKSNFSRRLLYRMLPTGRDADLSEIGQDLLRVRSDSLAPILRRAAERGELRAGVDPDEATRIFGAACLYDPIFHDTPVRPGYTAQLCEIFLYGILAPQIHDEVLIEDFQNREHMRALLRATTDAMIDPVALVEAVRDDDGRVTDFTFREVNPAACVYLQRRRDELVGGSMKATLPDIESSGMLARYIDCVQTGEPVMVEDFAYFSQRYQQTRRYDLRGARAGTDWLSMTWRDVTERYKRHQQTHSGDTDIA